MLYFNSNIIYTVDICKYKIFALSILAENANIEKYVYECNFYFFSKVSCL